MDKLDHPDTAATLAVPSAPGTAAEEEGHQHPSQGTRLGKGPAAVDTDLEGNRPVPLAGKVGPLGTAELVGDSPGRDMEHCPADSQLLY